MVHIREINTVLNYYICKGSYVCLLILGVVSTRCQYDPLECDYRYYVAINRTDSTRLPIHVEYPPGKPWAYMIGVDQEGIFINILSWNMENGAL